jgi:DNA repair exonuclease SbcCD ATPase subunit
MNGVDVFSGSADAAFVACIRKSVEEQASLRTERRELITEVGQLKEQIEQSKEEIEELSQQKATLERRLLEAGAQNSSLLTQLSEVGTQLALVQGAYTRLQELHQQSIDQIEEETRVKKELTGQEECLKRVKANRDKLLFRSRVVWIVSCGGGFAIGAPWLGTFFGGAVYALSMENLHEIVANQQKKVDELRAKIGLAPSCN